MPVAKMHDYTKDELDWAKDCIRTQYDDTLALLIELKRTTAKQKADREARDLSSNRIKDGLVRRHNERYGHAQPAKEVVSQCFADAIKNSEIKLDPSELD